MTTNGDIDEGQPKQSSKLEMMSRKRHGRVGMEWGSSVVL